MVGLRAVVMLRYVYCCSQEVAGFKYESDEKKSLDVRGMLLADDTRSWVYFRRRTVQGAS